MNTYSVHEPESVPGLAPPAEGDSTLYTGGTIHAPGHRCHPHATAMLVHQGQVAWIGTDAEAQTHHDHVEQVTELEGALVTAAFVDAHVHTSMTGQNLDGIDLSATQSVGEALRLIEAASRHTRGRPIYAHSWDETRWPEQRPVTAGELDRASHGGVVYMPRIDAHSASVSSALAAVARVHGMQGWDGTGVVTRDAFTAVVNAFTSGITEAERRHYIDLTMRAAAEAGIGLVHETGAPHLTSFEDLADVIAAGERGDGPETVAYWGQAVETVDEARELRRYLNIRGLAGDLCADGSIGSRTAHLREPYLDASDADARGYAYLTVEQVRDHVVACTRADLQAGYHVIGDQALQVIIAGMQAATEVVGTPAMRAARHRLDHAEMLDEDLITAMVQMGVHASVQPAFDAAWGGHEGMYAARLGRERALACNPLRTMHELGLPLAMGSDSPVTPLDPWGALRACVNHHNPAQRLPANLAFDAHTRGGWAIGRIDDGGHLDVGMPASFAVWGVQHLVDGLPDLSPEARSPVALRTVVRGRTIFDRDGALS